MNNAQLVASGSRYERGLRKLQEVAGTERPAILDSFQDIAPEVSGFVVEFAYGDVISRPGLSIRRRQLCTVAALAADGNATAQLQFHAKGALNVGVTQRELLETLIQTCVSAGFPAAINALVATQDLFTAALASDADHLTPAEGLDPEDRYERGRMVLAALGGGAGVTVISGLEADAPDFARVLVEFYVGDVYASDGLDLTTRGMIAVAACIAAGTQTAQLELQIHALMNVGGEQDEIVELMMQMAVYSGFPAALNAISALRAVVQQRDNGISPAGAGHVESIWTTWSSA